MHVGRSWKDSPLEDDCPCPKAPCGLVDITLDSWETTDYCDQHNPAQARTMRQAHYEKNCPALDKSD